MQHYSMRDSSGLCVEEQIFKREGCHCYAVITLHNSAKERPACPVISLIMLVQTVVTRTSGNWQVYPCDIQLTVSVWGTVSLYSYFCMVATDLHTPEITITTAHIKSSDCCVFTSRFLVMNTNNVLCFGAHYNCFPTLLTAVSRLNHTLMPAGSCYVAVLGTLFAAALLLLQPLLSNSRCLQNHCPASAIVQLITLQPLPSSGSVCLSIVMFISPWSVCTFIIRNHLCSWRHCFVLFLFHQDVSAHSLQHILSLLSLLCLHQPLPGDGCQQTNGLQWLIEHRLTRGSLVCFCAALNWSVPRIFVS
jgi:hypothetical protein